MLRIVAGLSHEIKPATKPSQDGLHALHPDDFQRVLAVQKFQQRRPAAGALDLALMAPPKVVVILISDGSGPDQLHPVVVRICAMTTIPSSTSPLDTNFRDNVRIRDRGLALYRVGYFDHFNIAGTPGAASKMLE